MFATGVKVVPGVRYLIFSVSNSKYGFECNLGKRACTSGFSKHVRNL